MDVNSGIVCCSIILFGCVSIFFVPVSILMFTENDWRNGIMIGIPGVLALIISGCALYGTIKTKDQTWIVEKEPYKVQNIVALGDGNMTEGRFYARRGYIGENLYYQYMVERENGGFVAGKAKANDIVLYYTDDEFRVEWYTLHREWWIFEEERDGYAKIYIPEGSISSEFNVDLE